MSKQGGARDMADQIELATVRRARHLTRELTTMTAHIEKISAERRGLVRRLISKYGWSQHQVASALDISQPAVHSLLKGEDE